MTEIDGQALLAQAEAWAQENKPWYGTAQEYEDMPTHDPDKLYIITG